MYYAYSVLLKIVWLWKNDRILCVHMLVYMQIPMSGAVYTWVNVHECVCVCFCEHVHILMLEGKVSPCK